MNTSIEEMLPFILRKDNICRIDNGRFLIFDRRSFPFQKRYEVCRSNEDIASAVRNMVTQGGGPLQVAFTALEWAALDFDCSTREKLEAFMAPIMDARKTNTTMKREISEILEDLSSFSYEDVHRKVQEREKYYDSLYDLMSDYGESLIDDGDVILTTCFAEHTTILSVCKAIRRGKDVRVLVNETRPYMQGSRLTAPCFHELGIDVKLITDGMGAYFMRKGEITRYMTACDTLAMDGSITNKVGTLANAICAHEYGIPYNPFAISPDRTKSSSEDFVLEMRDPHDVTCFLGHDTTEKGIEGLYPSFDIVDSKYITAVVTPAGVLAPSMIKEKFL